MTIEILRYPLITALVAVLLWIGAGRFLETETQAASLFADTDLCIHRSASPR